jgi:hypothetical protein
MRRLSVAVTSAFCLGVLALAAAAARPQELEPVEPEIVLPSVLLDLEDLSVERVTAAIPDESESPLLDLKFPLPDAGAAAVPEPEVEIQPPKAGVEGEAHGKGKDFTAEAELGAGNVDHVFGRFFLNATGEKVEGRILFRHETFDGFSGKPRGSGYNLRTDELEGGLEIGAKKARFGAEGGFAEREKGLQEKGAFYAKTDRFIGLGGDAELLSGGRFWMNAVVPAAATNRLFTGGVGVAEGLTEYLIEPEISLEHRFDRGALGATPRLSYRWFPDTESLSSLRGGVRAYARFDVSETIRVDGGVGWHYGDTTGNSVPFDVGLESDFSEYFSLSLRGGYRVEEMNVRDLFGTYPLMDTPGVLDDGEGWFFGARANWIPAQGWVFDAGILCSDSSAMPSFERTPDPASGLFPFVQEEALRVSLETGLRWNISETTSARLGWNAELAEKPEFAPRHAVSLEAGAEQKNGRFGGGLTVEYLLGVNVDDQLPAVGVDGFVQAADFMRFALELNDLLYPALDGPRLDWDPYVAVGFSVTLKALVNF